AGRDDKAARIVVLGVGRHAGRGALDDIGDPPVLDQNRAVALCAGRRVDHSGAGNDRGARHGRCSWLGGSKASRTAMRTATPISTWSVMTERGPSAMAGSISTPRFMGPGCMTMASGLA